jgi:alkyl sulfatase BDS1-like metallo-beta-lactamase superfamily hydrolase
MQLPPALEQAWHARGYYGWVSHNVKAVYQRYMGWYDGNPAHLWPHPPVAAARRYVDFMGGADAVVAKAGESFVAGDYRWVAEVLDRVVFAEPEHADARALLADTYEQLGYGSENGTWRCAYLSAATELRTGGLGTPVGTMSADVLAQLTPEQLFDALAVRVDGPRCWDERLVVDVDLTDVRTRHRLVLRNGVLTHTTAGSEDGADLVLRLPRAALPLVVSGLTDTEQLAAAGVTAEGDIDVLRRLLGHLEEPDPDFAIVTPD